MERDDFYVGGCETNMAEKSSNVRGQKSRVRGSCHRSKSSTSLFREVLHGGSGAQPASVRNKLSRASEAHPQHELRQRYQSLAIGERESLEQ